MAIKTVTSCPLGSECEQIKDAVMQRCAWFIELAGTNPNTGEQVNERGCAMSWIPILLIENSKQQHHTSAAVESFRNEMVQANQTSNQLLALATGLPALANKG
ncbi:hypothetical protein [Sapientia aquatica]|uniref:hypothetical protein n=1 Tax=Sapientia aquatica TaxID=1549640 RepID=UPI00197FE941|nr:hypothetical protein [Sapientia aquatica]